jgi:hypothetical protein
MEISDTNPFSMVNNLLKRSNLLNIQRVDDDEELMNTICGNLEFSGLKNCEIIFQYPEVYWCYIELSKEEYTKTVKEIGGLKQIKSSMLFYLNGFNNESLCIYQFVKELVQPGSTKKRKTIEELELQLQEAIEKENYEQASKIKTKIELKLINKSK